jgi:hypothetical protein
VREALTIGTTNKAIAVKRHRLITAQVAQATLTLKSEEIISEALGHAGLAFTLNTYSHIIEAMQSEAMACPMPSTVLERITPT